MHNEFLAPRKAAPDMPTSTKYTLIPPKNAATEKPPTAAKGDDDLMSMPGKRA